MKYYLQ